MGGMKRSPMPPRKQPLRRRAEIARTKDAHPTGSTLARRSAKRIAEDRERAKMRTGRCALEGYGTCWGPMDLHEIVRRAAAPGGRTDPRLVIELCREHHRLDESALYGASLGIRIPSHQWIACHGNADDEQRLIDAAARRRAEVITNGGPR